MGIERAFAGKRIPTPRLRWRASGRALERLRHVLMAVAISCLAFWLTVFDPVDKTLWMFQSKLAGSKASGDIVYIGSNDAITDPLLGHRRIDLAKALAELDRRGVGKVYLDMAFEDTSIAQADAALAKAIADLGPRIAIADQVVLDNRGNTMVQRSLPAIAGSATRVASDRRNTSYFGVRWSIEYGMSVDGNWLPTTAASMGGIHARRSGSFPIDYGFSGAQIASYPLSSLAQGMVGTDIDFAGKTVIIGLNEQPSSSRLIVPNSRYAPPSYISIYGGETLKSGRTGYIGAVQALTVFAALLACVILAGLNRRRRWLMYGLFVLAIPAALIATARIGVRLEISYTICFLLIFGLLRSRLRWKRRVALINQETGLPTLRALEARLARDGTTSGHVVVAKIHNYERILKTLPTEDRTNYILKLVDRLRATDPNLAVFTEGHYVGWHSSVEVSDTLIEHLSGLRAIFAAPVRVADMSVDVGITFGLAAIEGSSQGRVPAAIAVAEETSEAHEPIKLAESGEASDLLWDISLRARIDDAMEAGEIYCVYQPKIDSVSGSVAGVEALVRWHDPARGFIDPMHFVKQCEKAGRMEHLTRYVLQSACSAAQLLHFRGAPVTMSVNISATLLGDMRVVGLVRNALQATRFEAKYLTLEITETSRIADLDTARAVLDELVKIGVRLSIDDFGVGAANFETFFALPFHELKIDRLFVSNIVGDAKARAIVSSLVEMGHQARITVVAEGVETLREAEILNEIGCDELQGYVFSRPISLSKLLEFHAKRTASQVANMV